jgi:hypothetical protein
MSVAGTVAVIVVSLVLAYSKIRGYQ